MNGLAQCRAVTLGKLYQIQTGNMLLRILACTNNHDVPLRSGELFTTLIDLRHLCTLHIGECIPREKMEVNSLLRTVGSSYMTR